MVTRGQGESVRPAAHTFLFCDGIVPNRLYFFLVPRAAIAQLADMPPR
jgi:hypothetical protein